MKTISRSFYSMPVNCLFFVVVPLFYFLFVLAYDPFDISEFLAVGKEKFTLNLILTTLILLGVLTISRMLLFILRRIIDLNWSLYIVWCVGEVVFAGLMFSILLGIGYRGTDRFNSNGFLMRAGYKHTGPWYFTASYSVGYGNTFMLGAGYTIWGRKLN